MPGHGLRGATQVPSSLPTGRKDYANETGGNRPGSLRGAIARGQSRGLGRRSRPLSVRRLEQRVLLAGDLQSWYDPGIPDAVSDGYAAPAAAGLFADPQPDLVRMRLDLTDEAGSPVDGINEGGAFRLDVHVQDLRDAAVPDRGVFAAFGRLLRLAPGVRFGVDHLCAEYRWLADQSDQSTAGQIQDAGNSQTDLFAPLGSGEFLVLCAVYGGLLPDGSRDDNAATDSCSACRKAVRAWRSTCSPMTCWVDRGQFYGAAAGNPPITDVLFFNDPDNPVPTDRIGFGSDALQVNSTGSLSITDVGAATLGGTVVITSGGTRIQYTPPAAADALGTGETAFDLFAYTISDGRARKPQP